MPFPSVPLWHLSPERVLTLSTVTDAPSEDVDAVRRPGQSVPPPKHAVEPPKDRRNLRRGLRLGVLFAVPFLLASAVIRVAAPPEPDFVWHPTFSAKIDHLRETTEHYDVVFVGNSRTYLGVDPAIVEASLTAAGCPGVSTYNLGSVAQSKFEFDYMVETLADIPGGTPEYIVSLDRSLFEIGLVRDFDLRNRVFMTAGEYADSIDYISNLPDDTTFKSQAKAIDLTLGFAVNQIPVGAIHQQLFEQDSLEDEVALVEETRGFKGWDVIEAERGDEVDALAATVDADVASGAWGFRWSEKTLNQDQIDRWLSTIDAHVEQAPEGSTAIHVLIPSDFDASSAAQITAAWNDSGRSDLLLNLVDESLVGDFTDPGYWSDRFHVNEIGTAAISEALGVQICGVISQGQER